MTMMMMWIWGRDMKLSTVFCPFYPNKYLDNNFKRRNIYLGPWVITSMGKKENMGQRPKKPPTNSVVSPGCSPGICLLILRQAGNREQFFHSCNALVTAVITALVFLYQDILICCLCCLFIIQHNFWQKPKCFLCLFQHWFTWICLHRLRSINSAGFAYIFAWLENLVQQRAGRVVRKNIMFI